MMRATCVKCVNLVNSARARINYMHINIEQSPLSSICRSSLRSILFTHLHVNRWVYGHWSFVLSTLFVAARTQEPTRPNMLVNCVHVVNGLTCCTSVRARANISNSNIDEYPYQSLFMWTLICLMVPRDRHASGLGALTTRVLPLAAAQAGR